jgi:hypothetical protein
MNTAARIKLVVGWVLHVLIAGLMIFSGSSKILGFVPADAMEKYGLTEQIRLIGTGEVLSALLLLVPRTSSLGVLLVSSFWGGTICLHMSHGESYLMQSVLLVLTWVGAYLRNPATFSSFYGQRSGAQQVSAPSEAVVS